MASATYRRELHFNIISLREQARVAGVLREMKMLRGHDGQPCISSLCIRQEYMSHADTFGVVA